MSKFQTKDLKKNCGRCLNPFNHGFVSMVLAGLDATPSIVSLKKDCLNHHM